MAAEWSIDRFKLVAAHRRRKVAPKCPYEAQADGDRCACRWRRVR
jgi:hypothetical protein